MLQTLAFCIALENHPNRLHLIAGVSNATAKLNIVDCDGFGLANYFEGRCREGVYKDRQCIYIQSRTGEKVILISGGGKNGDEKLVKGNTYGMAYVTEANECAPAFIKEAFDRTLSSRDRKIFHDLNPKAEGHWYYTDILAQHEAKQAANTQYGYNYGHFTLTDNMSMPDEQLRQTIGTYDKGTVWYQRDILGKRKQAEGLVYPMFDPEPGGRHVFPAVPAGGVHIISVDYGTHNPFSAGLWREADGVAWRIREYYYSGRDQKANKTDEEYADEIEALTGGLRIKYVIVDPSASSFIETLYRRGYEVIPAKNDVLDGIREVAGCLHRRDIRFHESCTDSIREFGMYHWDDRLAEDKPVKEHGHAMDDIRYFCYTQKELKNAFSW